MKQYLKLVQIIFASLILGSASDLSAAGRSADAASKLRMKIQLPRSSAKLNQKLARQRIVLPVSRAFNQGKTGLCWAYSLLNILETNYYAANPTERPELSRRSLQVFKWEERYHDYIAGLDFVSSEFGTTIDGLTIARQKGLVTFHDYLDITDAYGNRNIIADIDQAPTYPEKMAALISGLDLVFRLPPKTTNYREQTYTLPEFAQKIAGNSRWITYAPSEHGPYGLAQHPDPDARPGTLALYVPKHDIHGIVKSALENGHGIEFTSFGHSTMIYGADYDSSGLPLTYYIKDSSVFQEDAPNEAFYYPANPEIWLDLLLEITTIN